MKEIDRFYLDQPEPIRSCLMALRTLVLQYNLKLEPVWKYRLPCFIYQNQIFCYLWVDRKTKQPYIAIGKGVQIDHPDLIQGNRTFVKLFMVNPKEDIPVKKIYQIFDLAMDLYDD
jgi:hypothetical protein